LYASLLIERCFKSKPAAVNQAVNSQLFWRKRTESQKGFVMLKKQVDEAAAKEAGIPAVIAFSHTIYQAEYEKLLSAMKDSLDSNLAALKIVCDKRIAVSDSCILVLTTNSKQKDSLIGIAAGLIKADSLSLKTNLAALDSTKRANDTLVNQLQKAKETGKVKFWTGLGLGAIIGQSIKSIF
jgi:hypothetical protein